MLSLSVVMLAYADVKAVVIKQALVFFSTVVSVLRFGVVVVNKDFLVVVVNDATDVWHAAVAYFHVLVKDGWRLWFGGKYFLIRLRKVLVTLVCTFLMYGRLNQMMFLLRFLLALLSVFLLDDKADNLRLMAAGICLVTVGGWLDFVLM